MAHGQDPAKPPLKRQDVYEELRVQVRALQQKIDPELLEQARKLITTASQPVSDDITSSGEIKIDRQANIKWVSAFLSSPAGANLRERLLNKPPNA